MKKLSIPTDIWPPSQVQPEDIEEAINYAKISVPWTFDRMRYGPNLKKRLMLVYYI